MPPFGLGKWDSCTGTEIFPLGMGQTLWKMGMGFLFFVRLASLRLYNFTQILELSHFDDTRKSVFFHVLASYCKFLLRPEVTVSNKYLKSLRPMAQSLRKLENNMKDLSSFSGLVIELKLGITVDNECQEPACSYSL